MRRLLDEDSQRKRLAHLLREAGHDVRTVTEASLDARPDAEVLAFARQEGRVLLTRNVQDFQALHVADATHPGILAEHQDQDQDPRKNMTAEKIVRAIDNLKAREWNIAGQFVALNAWNFA